MTSVAIICPTNKRDTAMKYLLSESSLRSLKHLADKVCLYIIMVGQGEFLKNEFWPIFDLCTELKIGIEVFDIPETDPCSIFNLRTIGAQSVLAREADYHLIVDDNNEFVPESSAVYWEIIQYMNDNPKCGSVACCGFFGSKAFGDEIRPDRTGWMVETGKGLFLRNAFEGEPFPEGTDQFVGGFEESLAVIKLNRAGFYHAKRFKVRTKHHGVKPTVPKGSVGSLAGGEYRDGDNQLHSRELTEKNAFRWIRQHVKADYQYGMRIFNLGMEFPR